MRQQRAIIAIITVLLVTIMVAAAGCITIVEKPAQKAPPATKAPTAPAAADVPVIKSFTASKTAVAAGQQAQLSWEVSGGQNVAISPVVGAVDAAGSVLVSPTATTTYTLTATNAAGSSTASVTITVTAAAASRAELAVTDIQLITRDVYYRVKNSGNAGSKACTGYLYVNGIKSAESYIEALAPGQERLTTFSNYSFPYVIGAGTEAGVYDATKQFIIKVCVDVENVVVENDETNNCRTVIWGDKFVYRFVDVAHQAAWSSGYGVLKLPLPEENAGGAALVAYQTLEDNQGYGSVLVTIPQQVPNGWIQGMFGEFYTDELRQTRVRVLTIPDMSRFTARVGFSSTTPSGSKAKFTFGTADQSGVVTWAPALTASMDGKLELYNVNLSNIAGRKVMFVLRAEVIGPADRVKPIWVDPVVAQP